MRLAPLIPLKRKRNVCIFDIQVPGFGIGAAIVTLFAELLVGTKGLVASDFEHTTAVSGNAMGTSMI